MYFDTSLKTSRRDVFARQNKLELPNEEEEVNTRDIHKCDGQAHDPDTMAGFGSPTDTQADSLQFFFSQK